MNPLISIVVPVYNASETVVETIKSIEKQSYDNLELIVVDDGSNDNSYDVVSDYLPKTNLKYQLIKQENQGLSGARNTGISKCEGDYISFIDSDDLISDDFYQNALKFFGKADVIVTNILYQYKNRDECSNQMLTGDLLTVEDKSFYNVFVDLNPMTPNKIFKREVFNKIKFIDKVIFEDVLLWNMLYDEIKVIGFVPNSKYIYRIQSESLSNAVDTRYIQLLQNWEYIVKFYKDNGTFDKHYKILYYGCYKYTKDIMMRKFVKILNYSEYMKVYDRANKFIKNDFSNYKNTLILNFDARHLYLLICKKWYYRIFWLIYNHKVFASKCKHKIKKFLFNKNKYFATLKKQEDIFYDNNSKVIEVEKPYFDIKYESHFYGIKYHLFKHFDLNFSNKVFVEHGYNFSDVVSNNYSVLTADYLITATSNRQKSLINRYGKPTLVCGPYIQYATAMYDEKWEQDIKSKYGKILTVFPSHSIQDYNANYDVELLLNKIEKVKSEKQIDTVFICLYYKDLNKKNFDLFNKYKIVSTGHKNSVDCLSKLKSIISVSDYTMSNEIGSHIPYVFSMNKPHYLVKDNISYEGKNVDHNSQRMKSYKRREQEILDNIFTDDFVYYEDQKELIDKYFNVNVCLTKTDITEFLESEYEI